VDRVSRYIASLFAPEDALLVALREEADRSGLPPTSISPEIGRFLQVLLSAVAATRVLEVGTLGGYSAIWMARALPAEGTLVTIERDEHHAAFAERYIRRAGLSGVVSVRCGRALDVLPALDGERFDAIFLDADKQPLPTYLEWALRLVRPGGLIIADNALLGGRAADRAAADGDTAAVREFNRRFATEPRITGIIVPAHDGLAVGVVAGG
jgi:predicted O-methyltransferase YrrM